VNVIMIYYCVSWVLHQENPKVNQLLTATTCTRKPCLVKINLSF